MKLSDIENFYQIVKEDGFRRVCGMVDRCDKCPMSQIEFNDIVTLKDVYCGDMFPNREKRKPEVLNKLTGIIRKEKLRKLLS